MKLEEYGKKGIKYKIACIFLSLIMLVTTMPITPITKWLYDYISVEAVGITTIDLTNLFAGNDANHNHIYEKKYDSNYHWEECWMCGNKVNIHAHNLTIVGTAGCSGALAPQRKYCQDGCGYNVQLEKVQHTYPSTWSLTDDTQVIHVKTCSVCGDWIVHEKCKNSNGQELGCATGIIGTCVGCGHNYTDVKHGIMNTIDKTNRLKCVTCHRELAEYNVTKEIVNATTTRMHYTIIERPGIIIDIDNRKAGSCIAQADDYWNFIVESVNREGNKITASALFNPKDTASTTEIECHLAFDNYSYNGVQQAWVHIGDTYVKPCNYAPIRNNIRLAYWGIVDNFSKGAHIYATYTDEWDSPNNMVYMRLIDSDRNTVISDWGAATKEGTTYTRRLDVMAEIREPLNIYVQVKDACGNITTLEEGAISIKYIDTIAPRLTGGQSSSNNWSKNKEITYTTIDQGVGGVQIAFNNEADFQVANKNGDIYTRTYNFIGDVYGTIRMPLYIKDALGNIRTERVSISNIDNTEPTIINVSQNLSSDQLSNTLTVSAHDENATLKALGKTYTGSGVAGYAITETNAQPNTFQASNSFTVTKNGTYYLWAKDTAGNISIPQQITINNIGRKAKITLNKTDSVTGTKLNGATFGLYEWNGNTYVKRSTLTDNGNGAYTTEVIEYTVTNLGKFRIIEEKAPTNYYENSTWHQDIELTEGGYHEYSYNVTNVPYPNAVITLNKTDSITEEKLNGAIFGLYEWNGSTYVKRSTLTDNGNGTYTTQLIRYSTANLGKFRIIEEVSPTYYTNSNWTKDINLTEAGYHEYSYNVTNVPNRVKVQAIKVDGETKNRLQGTTFTIYEWNKETGSYQEYARNTKMNFASDRSYLSDWLYANRRNEGKFKIVETGTPNGYFGDYSNGNRVENYIIVTPELDGKTVTIENGAGLYKNTRVKGTINVNKIDKETNRYLAQGDASLDGAVYGLYAAEDIYHKDTVKGKIYNKDELVQSQRIANGGLSFQNVEIGKYYIKEITPPKGYLLSDQKYEVDMNYEGETVAHLTKSITIQEQVKKQAFELQKIGINNSNEEVNPLKNVGFKIYLIKDLAGVKNGSITPDRDGIYNVSDFIDYDFSSEETAINYSANSNGERIPELFTDEDGQMTSPELAYGKYVVIESTVPENMLQMQPFIVTIEQDSRTPQKQRYFINREFEALVKVIKKDSQTGQTVLNKNSKYRIWSITENKYIEQTIPYPTMITYGTEDNPFITNGNGEFITPLKLPVGEYELREVEAPEGYILTGYEGKMDHGTYIKQEKSAVKFSITTNTAYYEDPASKEFVINVIQYNDEMLGELEITKTGEKLTRVETKEDGTIEPIYEESKIQGVEFSVYAKEDIYSQDNQGTKLCEKDGLVRKITTDAEGKAYLDNIPIGKYYVKETKAGEGFILNEEVKEFEISYQGEKTAIQKVEMSYKNERQKISLNEKDKKDEYDEDDEEKGLKVEKIADKTVYKSGEEIIYTIKVTNTTKYSIKDIMINEALIKGKFDDISTNNVTKIGDKTIQIKELRPDESVELKFRVEIKELNAMSKATKTLLEEEKTKITNNVKAIGQITKPDPNNPKETITRNIKGEGKEEIYVSNKDLIVVKEALKEEYEIGEKVDYIIKVINNGKAEITDINIEEELLGGRFVNVEEANSNGVKVTQINNQKVRIDKIEPGETIILRYEYTISESTRIKTTQNKNIILENKVNVTGKTEKPAPDNPENIIKKEVKDEDIQEIEVKKEISGSGIIKKDIETGERLEGAVIGLYTSEDIRGGNGDILIRKDTLVQKVTTNKVGEAVFTVDLPLGKYYIKEIEAPKGYKLSEEKIEIDSNYNAQGEIKINKVLLNRSTEIKIVKKDEQGNLINGAKLEVLDEQGRVVDSWETKEEVHKFRKLEAGKTYKLREKEPAKGYVTAEDIKFEINQKEDLYSIKGTEETGMTLKEYKKVDNLEMIDEKTKVKIEVIDKETKENLAGMKIQIIDKETNQVIYETESSETPKKIVGLPIGKYEIVSKDPIDSRYVTTKKEIGVKDTKEEQEISIEQDYTKIKINLRDEETKEIIYKGKIEIKDENRKVIKTIEPGEQIERLPEGQYTLHQIEVQTGYHKSEDVKIQIEDKEEVQEFEILNKRKVFKLTINKLLKSQILNGEEVELTTTLSKLEIKPQDIAKIDLKLVYEITVKNEGELAGSAEVKEDIPKGLEMIQESNSEWEVKDGIATTNTGVIEPGESRTYTVTLKWKNTLTNLGMKENKASIISSENEAGFENIGIDNEENQENQASTSEASIFIGIKTGEGNEIFIILISIIMILSGIEITLIIKLINKRTMR